MNKNTIIIDEIIEIIRELICIKKESQITIQDLNHATQLSKEAAQNQEDLIFLLEDFINEIKKLRKEEQEKVLSCIMKIYKELFAFDEECSRIIDMKKGI